MKHTTLDILNAFMSDKTNKKSFGNFKIDGNKLVYQAQSSKEVRSRWADAAEFDEAQKSIGKMIRDLDGKLTQNNKTVLLESLTKDSSSNGLRVGYYETEVVAQKVNTPHGMIYFGNTDTLALVGRTVAYGNVSSNIYETEIQVYMQSKGFTMIPLGQFASKDFTTLEILDRGNESITSATKQIKVGKSLWGKKNVQINIKSRALLFSLEKTCYLFDIDNNNHESFVVELPKHVKTIADAYQSLKPKEVVQAESSGTKIMRFGSYFLISVPMPTMPVLTIDEKLTILGAHANYGLDDITVTHLIGQKKVPHGNAALQNLMKKVPRAMRFGSKQASTAIVLDNKTYCAGELNADSTHFKINGWYQVVARVGKTLEVRI